MNPLEQKPSATTTGHAIDWSGIDTVLLDMDGTLLDLHYDNQVWNHLLPRHYSSAHGIGVEEASTRLSAHMREIFGRIEFYCLDYWAGHTRLDVMAPHQEAVHLIRWRPNALAFVRAIRRSGRRAILVTNAHRGSIGIKDLHCGITGEMDAVVSSHDYGAPKESRIFWDALMTNHPFDVNRTLFVDDNIGVLNAARSFGVRQLRNIAQPDASRPRRTGLDDPAIEDFLDYLPVPEER